MTKNAEVNSGADRRSAESNGSVVEVCNALWDLSCEYPPARKRVCDAIDHIAKLRQTLKKIADTVDTSQGCPKGNEMIAVWAMDALKWGWLSPSPNK